ncbi:MAG: hypothetical protein G4V63_32800 [Candidatus Afipia apatlaquensis]|uniref:Uncharacterized protein n=1 Tax=Candidatus Afipia apatlaquensis TaxID=2712852 RepID=A0A7C9VMD1_9BRAD|nr:hypothetical protein [Candidatus Afipia apatlaquensis]
MVGEAVQFLEPDRMLLCFFKIEAPVLRIFSGGTLEKLVSMSSASGLSVIKMQLRTGRARRRRS